MSSKKIEESEMPSGTREPTCPFPLTRDEYTDFTIKCCHGINFRVHKHLLASASPVFRAAFRGNYAENRTNVYEIHFDSRLVDQMIEFIYSGDYASYTHDCPELGSTKSGRDLPIFLPPFLYHVRIALLADIYQVDKLRYLAAARARAVLKNDHCLWSDILLRQMKVFSIWQRLERRASLIVKNAQGIESYLVTALDNPDWPHFPPEGVALLTERTDGLTTKLEKWEELRQNRVPLEKMTAKSREKQEGFRIEEDNVLRQVRKTIKEIEEYCRIFQGSWWDLIEVAPEGPN